jgi:hypothetical protein
MRRLSLGHGLVLGWTFLLSATLLECRGTDCHPARGGVAQVEQRSPVFPTQAACEAMRQQLQMPAVGPTVAAGTSGMTMKRTYRTGPCEDTH